MRSSPWRSRAYVHSICIKNCFESCIHRDGMEYESGNFELSEVATLTLCGNERQVTEDRTLTHDYIHMFRNVVFICNSGQF